MAETIVTGIGHGYVLSTPLQLAVMAARIANGGRAVVPRIVRDASLASEFVFRQALVDFGLPSRLATNGAGVPPPQGAPG